MKKLIYTFILLIMVVASVAGYYFKQYRNFLETPVFENTTTINIKKGQSFLSFLGNIIEKNANGTAWQWRLFARLEKVDQWLTVGEFNIDVNVMPMQMMEKIQSNDVTTYQFTIIEGSNWRELKQKFSVEPVLKYTLDDMTQEALLLFLGADEKHLEGLFLPETYQFVRGDSDVDVLKRAYVSLKKHLQASWKDKKNDLPFNNPYELLILASIVEKETAQAHERGTIAGVFVRRLLKDMRLQTDPTVIYGLGSAYDGDIKKKDLTTDTPYNTYTRKGLPPTPIAMAGAAAISAAAVPEEGNFLYFVANNRGGHYFSETYQEHQKAVQDYLKGKKL